MKKTLLVFVALLALVIPVKAQDAVYEIGNITSSGSIIREYAKDIFIVYNQNGTARTFNYVDLNANVVYSANVPLLVVNDFEIYDSMVYFCGLYSGFPSVGDFKVNDLFFSGYHFRITNVPTFACPEHSGYADNITSLDKIEVMPMGSGMPHLILTGSAHCSYFQYQQNRCIATVFHDGTNWNIEMSQEHEAILHYDDVAVTDNNVVFVGHKNQVDGEYIYSLPQPPSYTGTLANANMYNLLTPCLIYAAGGWSTYTTAQDASFVIEHIKSEKFATTCHGGYGVGFSHLDGTVINIYNTVSNVVNRYLIPDTCFIVRDMKYNKQTNSLLLLHDTSATAGGSSLHYFELFLDNTFTAVTNAQMHSDLSRPVQYSLDACYFTYPYGQAIISGSSAGSNSLHLWRHLPSPGLKCSDTKDIDLRIMDNSLEFFLP